MRLKLGENQGTIREKGREFFYHKKLGSLNQGSCHLKYKEISLYNATQILLWNLNLHVLGLLACSLSIRKSLPLRDKPARRWNIGGRGRGGIQDRRIERWDEGFFRLAGWLAGLSDGEFFTEG